MNGNCQTSKRLVTVVVSLLVVGCSVPNDGPIALATQNSEAISEAMKTRRADTLGACVSPELAIESFDLVQVVTLVTNWYRLDTLEPGGISDEPTLGHRAVRLTGTSISGLPLHENVMQMPTFDFEIARRELQLGREVVVGVNDPQTHVAPTVVVAADDQVAFVGNCAWDIWTNPLRTYAQEQLPSDARTGLESLLQLVGPNASHRNQLAELAGGSLVNSQRSQVIHPDSIPASEFAKYSAYTVSFTVTEAFRSSDDKLCLRSQSGWSECGVMDAVEAGTDLHLRAYAQEAEDVEVWLYDAEVEPQDASGVRLVTLAARELGPIVQLSPAAGISSWAAARAASNAGRAVITVGQGSE